MLNYYEILGVSPYATPAEIKSAFKKKAVLYHPDKNPDDKVAEEQFKLVNEAYQTLNNAYKKSVYDQRLFYKDETKIANSTTSYSNSGTSKRNYTSYRRRTYKGYNPYNPQLHFLTLGGFVVCLVIAWLIYHLIGNYQSDKNYSLAFAFYQQKNYQAAFDKAHEAILQNDNNVQAYYLRGILLANYFNEPKKALYCFDRCIIYGRDAAPDDKNKLTLGELPDFYWQRANCFYKIGNYNQTITDCKQVVKYRPDDLAALSMLGNIYLFKYNRLNLANEAYQKVLQTNPTSTTALLGRAVVHFYLGNHQFCLGELERLAVTEEKNATLHYFLGRSYLQHKKDTALACGHFAQATEIGHKEAVDFKNKYCPYLLSTQK